MGHNQIRSASVHKKIFHQLNIIALSTEKTHCFTLHWHHRAPEWATNNNMQKGGPKLYAFRQTMVLPVSGPGVCESVRVIGSCC